MRRRVVVDASVLVAALMKDGTCRDLLLHADVHFVAPRQILEETRRHVARAAQRAGVPQAVAAALMEEIQGRVQAVADAAFAQHMDRAQAVAEAAGAPEDAAYAALALSLDAPVWTLDHGFCRMEGIATLASSDLQPEA